MFYHRHPYPPYILSDTTRLIVGTLPPPRFTTGNLNRQDVDFCYGSSNGLLWKIWDQIYHLDLVYDNSSLAIEQRKAFLKGQKIGICDIVSAAYRQKVDASDIGMERVELRDLLGILIQYPLIDTLIFTGGKSKNGPKYFFRKVLKQNQLELESLVDDLPRKHCFFWAGRTIITQTLTAPSGAANRAIGSMAAYKAAKAKSPNYSPFEFRVQQYRKVFKPE